MAMTAALLCWALVLFPQDSEREIQTLIRQLSAEDPRIRDLATEELKKVGQAAVPALRRVASRNDKEAAARASYLLRFFELSRTLTQPLQKVIPDAVERLAAGDSHTWTEVFLKAVSSTRRWHPNRPSLQRADLEGLAGRALSGARTDKERCDAGGIILARGYGSLYPEIARTLQTHGLSRVGDMLAYQFTFDTSRVIPHLLPLLADPTRAR